MRRLRDTRTIPIDSPVGESERNGRVENAIRRIQDKARTIEAQVEGETGVEVSKLDGFMSWLTRWAAELTTRYSVGKDGETAHERLKGKSCTKPMAQLGESVMYLPL